MTTPTRAQRLQGLAATLGILLLVAGVPFLLIAIGAAPWKADLDEPLTKLSSPDDGTLAMAVIAAVAWLAWLIVAVSVVLEVIAQLRGLPTPTIPGLGTPQRAVGHLVAVAALLFVAAPTVVAAFPSPPAHAATTAPVHETPHLAAVQAAPLLPQAAPLLPTPLLAHSDSSTHMHPTADSTVNSTVDYNVKRGDSLWKIAERLLGDGTRFTEIFELNRDVLNEPSFITPGTVLKVPHEVPREASKSAADRPAEAYVVKPGDTLSEIASATLGDPMRYPELVEASRDTVQPDGAKLTDPDLIRPGWEITLPSQAKHKAEERPAVAPPAEVAPPNAFVAPAPVNPPAETPSVEPTLEPTNAAEPEPGVVASDDVDDELDDSAVDEVESSSPGWLVPGLTGAGAVLASLVLLAIRAHRHTQLRYRRPGQTIAPPPEELLAVEKTAFVAGAPLAKTIEDLDRALMHLAGDCADTGRALPLLVTATLAKSMLTLKLAENSDLPDPWAGAGQEWSLNVNQSLPARSDVLPPYPLLTTVGQDESGLHLVNLEHLGVVTLAGDLERAKALGRHVAAELALNPWSSIVEVNLIGFGEELAPLDSLRLRHHPHGGQVVPAFVRQVTTSLEHGWGDPDPYRVVVTTADGTLDLAPLLASPSSRTGTVLVSLAEPVPGSTVIKVDPNGRLTAPSLGLDLRSAGLTRDEARACAAIVDLTRDGEPVRIAPFERAADGWRAFADQAGALREELTIVRGAEPAGSASLLPNAAKEYVAAASTMEEDLETLAPVVPEQSRRTVEEADPTLDAEVAEWFDSENKRPRLRLLGAVHAQAFGVMKPVIQKRRPYFVEILAYLALRPKGATASEVADAFGIAPSRARTDVSSLRDWLGTNPRTGCPYLPAANDSPVYLESGVKTYQVHDILVDVDLFRRLRARGEARGSEGIDDLKTAMSLVQGLPFSFLREKGWSWLLDTERVHETIGCAIVDTAHILVTDSMAKGELDLARDVAEAACEAAPYDDICRLDLVKVAAAQGHQELADQLLTDHVFNRTDDYLPPIDLPHRTGEVVGKEGWHS